MYGGAKLYEVRVDPLERVDLAASFPEVVANLSTRLQAWRDELADGLSRRRDH